MQTTAITAQLRETMPTKKMDRGLPEEGSKTILSTVIEISHQQFLRARLGQNPATFRCLACLAGLC